LSQAPLKGSETMAIPTAFAYLSSAPCETCPIIEDSLCLPLPAKQRNALRRLARARMVPQGQSIFKEGDELTSFAAILTGVVKLTKASPGGGREQIVTFKYPPELLGLTYDDVHLYSAIAATEVQLCLYPRASFLPFLNKSRELSRRILEVKSNELELAWEWTATLGRKSAYRRVAGLFAILAQRAQPQGGATRQFLLPVTRADLADYLGLTLETVSRNITILRQKSLIELLSAREVVVRDLDGLLAEAGMLN
jgi:CRP/FNR family transcriptional regulator, anaerobic regulatory protein